MPRKHGNEGSKPKGSATAPGQGFRLPRSIVPVPAHSVLGGLFINSATDANAFIIRESILDWMTGYSATVTSGTNQYKDRLICLTTAIERTKTDSQLKDIETGERNAFQTLVACLAQYLTDVSINALFRKMIPAYMGNIAAPSSGNTCTGLWSTDEFEEVCRTLDFRKLRVPDVVVKLVKYMVKAILIHSPQPVRFWPPCVYLPFVSKSTYADMWTWLTRAETSMLEAQAYMDKLSIPHHICSSADIGWSEHSLAAEAIDGDLELFRTMSSFSAYNEAGNADLSWNPHGHAFAASWMDTCRYWWQAGQDPFPGIAGFQLYPARYDGTRNTLGLETNAAVGKRIIATAAHKMYILYIGRSSTTMAAYDLSDYCSIALMLHPLSANVNSNKTAFALTPENGGAVTSSLGAEYINSALMSKMNTTFNTAIWSETAGDTFDKCGDFFQFLMEGGELNGSGSRPNNRRPSGKEYR